MSQRRARSLPKGRSIPVVIRADPARKRRWSALIDIVGRAKREQASGFDAYWEAVAEIVDHGLYADGGYDTVDAFVRDVCKMAKRSATRMMRVARHASPKEEERYGVAVLDAALGYIEALTGGPVVAKLPVAFAKLRIPVVRSGKKTKVGLDVATVVEIRAATRALLRPKKADKVAPEEAKIRAALAKHKELADIEARVAAGSVRFGPVPLGLVALLNRVLARVNLDQ